MKCVPSTKGIQCPYRYIIKVERLRISALETLKSRLYNISIINNH